MKKVVCVLLSIFMIMNIAACGNGTAAGEAAAETAARATETAETASAESESETASAESAAQAPETAEAVPEPSEAVSEPESGSESGIRLWTDSTGREVEVPEKITKIALSGPLSQIVLYALAPEMLVGFSNEWSGEARQYIPEEYLALPTLGQLYGGKGELNLEELLKADPDVVIDVGDSKKTIREDMDALTEQTGIPFVHVDMATATAGDAYRMLGDLLGLEERAEVYAAYCDTAYQRALDLMEQVGEEGKKRLLYVTGDEGLNVIAQGSYHAEVIDLLSDNLAVVDDPSAKGTGNEVDMEQILAWNPDYVIFAPESIYSTVGEMEEWQNVTAIRDGNYWEVPYGPYNWMGFPPSVQRYLGLMWMPVLLYPDYVDYDLKEEVVQYYDLFYHCELTDEQYAALTANSIGN